MRINPYLTFNGNCKEVFEFYKEALNGEIVLSNTFAEAPAEMNVPEDEKGKIMHTTLKAGDAILMGSDNFGPNKEHFSAGNNVSISVNFESEEEIKAVYERFAAAGTVTMPLTPTFWGSMFGMVMDQFGMHWMFNCELKNP